MAKTRIERVNVLTAKIDKWDQQIEEITALRSDAVNEIASLLGLTSTATKSSPVKTAPTEKLGDRIMAVLEAADGQTREYIVSKLKEGGQRVSLALYHLDRNGHVYEREGKYFLNLPTTPVVAEI